MGVLDSIGDAASNSASALLSGILNPFKHKTKPVLNPPDFRGGFIIIEYKNNKAEEPLVLNGDMMPMIPFKYGGEQKTVKNYYPGNPEPVYQMLGPRESNVVIHGRLKSKHYQDPKFAQLPATMAKALDLIRQRGNVLKIILGEWIRYATLEKSEFDLKQLTRIEYELTFSIIGLTAPTNCKVLNALKILPSALNTDLLISAAAFQAKYSAMPKPMPKGLGDLLTGLIGDIGSVMTDVTTSVQSVISAVQSVDTLANRAIGLIKNAKATLKKFSFQVRSIELSLAHLGNGIGNISSFSASVTQPFGGIPPSLTNAQVVMNAQKNTRFILQARSDSNNLMALLNQIHAQFSALVVTVPQSVYTVHAGDTLQKIAYKFYHDSNKWDVIYSHNHLTSTDLTGISSLEIPKQ